MARLIDVTDLINTCKSLSDEHEATSISYNALYEVLLQQPIAYDVEKVVEELDKIPCVVDQWNKVYLDKNDAIEIVRKGGVE